MRDELPTDRIRRLTRREWAAMGEAGLFASERVELLRGVIVAMSPQGSRRAHAIRRLTMLLAPALAGRADVQVQLPFAAAVDSEPEPDVSVVPVVPEGADHPGVAHLVIEVAESSLRDDLRIEVPLHAEAGVPEVWVVDVVRRVVHVHRDPAGGAYDTTFAVAVGGDVAPLAFPTCRSRRTRSSPADPPPGGAVGDVTGDGHPDAALGGNLLSLDSRPWEVNPPRPAAASTPTTGTGSG